MTSDSGSYTGLLLGDWEDGQHRATFMVANLDSLPERSS